MYNINICLFQVCTIDSFFQCSCVYKITGYDFDRIRKKTCRTRGIRHVRLFKKMLLYLFLLFIIQRFSHSLSQLHDEASLGIIHPPLGDNPQVPTLGPSGRHERLNCWLKKRRKNTDNHFLIVLSSYCVSLKALRARRYILLGR